MTKKKSTSLTPKCFNCKRVVELFCGVRNGVYYENLCNRCVGHLGSADFARQYERTWQRRHYAKDIIQSDDPEYVKAYGADKARERGWSEEDIRRFG